VFFSYAEKKTHGLPADGDGRERKHMNWSEVITVRSTGSNTASLKSALLELMGDLHEDDASGTIRIYHREKIDTDFCIILSHAEESVLGEGSPLGLRLVAALKAFGLVNHSVWIEMK
jgi:hypothetical protein